MRVPSTLGSLFILLLPSSAALPTMDDVNSVTHCVDRWVPQAYALLEQNAGALGTTVAENVQETKCKLHAHPPIRIVGDLTDTDALLNGITSGRGSTADPWIIEGWEISGIGTRVWTAPGSNVPAGDSGLVWNSLAFGAGISITASTQSFVIRAVYIHDFPDGINLDGVTNVQVLGSRIETNDWGPVVWIYRSTGIRVEGNIIPYHEIRARESYGVTIRGNDVQSCYPYCVFIEQGGNVHIEGNSLHCSYPFGGGDVNVHAVQVYGPTPDLFVGGNAIPGCLSGELIYWP